MDSQTRDLLTQCDVALKDATDAADQLMSEFVSHKYAADWGIINDGLVAAKKARIAISEQLKQ